MKNILFSLLTMFCIMVISPIHSQAPGISWERSFGGTSNDDGYSIINTSDGGYLIAGATSSSNGDAIETHGNEDAMLIKLNALGNIEWKKLYGGTGADWAYSVIQTNDGGYAFAGMSSSQDGDSNASTLYDSDMWIVKITSTGTIQWYQNFGGTSGDKANCIRQTADGGYIIAGETLSTNGDFADNHGNYDAVAIKLSTSGDLQWKHCYGGTAHDDSKTIIQTPDGGYVMGCSSNSIGGQVTAHVGTVCSQDFWVVKLDMSGNILWNKCHGAISVSGDSYAQCIQMTSDGGFVMLGYGNGNHGNQGHIAGYYDILLVKMNSTGSKLWEKTYGGSGYDQAYRVIEMPSGGYVIAGYSQSADGSASFNHGNYLDADFWLIRTDALGNIVWQKSYGGSDSDYGNDVCLAPDGGFVMLGKSYSHDNDIASHTTGPGFDYWLMKTGAENLGLPDVYAAPFTLYPNPANGTVYVSLQPADTILVSNAAGQVISVFHNASKIDVTTLPKGIYFVRTISDSVATSTQKLIRE